MLWIQNLLVGKPIIKGMRLAATYIVELLALGWNEEAIIKSYPGVARKDIRACLAYASDMLNTEKPIRLLERNERPSSIRAYDDLVLF